jgi:LacI family transcriptional regulator
MRNAVSQTSDSGGLPSATMQTIAERLGLSVATVSRALRRIPGINPKTRARVMQTAAQMGYHLPKNYRSEPLDNGQLHHIGALIELPKNHMPPDAYIVGMSDAAMTLNASLVIHYVKAEHCERILQPEFQPRAMSAGLLSGLILVFRWPTEIVRELSRTRPIVSIAHKYPGVDTDMLGIDSHGGIDLLARHLHGLGHRKIGFFGRCGDLHWASARFGAYAAALTSLGLLYRPEWVVDVDLEHLTSYESSWDAYCSQVKGLVEEGVRAWICASEPAGWQLTDWLRAHEIRVPEDVSVVGFHPPDKPEPGKPILTSVRASYEAIGAAALKRMLYRIQNPAESTRTILFPGELHIGQTTAPPPS